MKEILEVIEAASVIAAIPCFFLMFAFSIFGDDEKAEKCFIACLLLGLLYFVCDILARLSV